VLEEIGNPEGDWMVHIHEAAESPAWYIRIVSPDGKRWERTFLGVAEQDDQGNFVRGKIREAMTAYFKN
jgi:hypothetical protein